MKTTRQATSLPPRQPLAQGIALALAFSAGAAQAAVFNVTTNADSGPGSLRQAVLDANASPGADQITFNAGLGTINLTTDQIGITETLTITGPATGQTIDAGGNSRILAVTVAGQPLTLENLTVTGGRTLASGYGATACADGNGRGGGICALGDVTLTNSTVSGNSTAGMVPAAVGFIFGEGNATLNNSTVSGNHTAAGVFFADGGGLSVLGNATLINSTVSGNSTAGVAAFGGGFSVRDNATLINSSVSGNSTAGDDAFGGGLAMIGGNATLINSTVSGNSTAGSGARGGGLSVRGDATLTNSTVSGNSTAGPDADGGGLYLYKSDAWLSNSTVTANQSTTGAGGIQIRELSFSPYGSPPANLSLILASTLLAANSGPDGNFAARIEGGGSVTLDATNSLFGDDPAEVNGIDTNNVFTDTPELAPLADNGCAVLAGAPGSGACVQTHALLTGSPAIDAGDDAVCADEPVNGLDQRGEPRPADGNNDNIAICDIGAFERQVATTPIDYDITGSWYNPATDGQGFSL